MELFYVLISAYKPTANWFTHLQNQLKYPSYCASSGVAAVFPVVAGLLIKS